MNSDLGFIYLAEQVSPEKNIVNNMEIVDKNGIFYVEFDTCLQTFMDYNRNNRIYDGQNIWDCIMSERIQSYLSDGGWFGEENHPTPEYKNVELHPDRLQDIKMSNTSHKIINPKLQGDMLISRIQTDSGTPAGINMAKKIIQGLRPSFSARAIARLQPKNGKPMVFMRKLITYDWVLFPSHKGAHQIGELKFVNKSVPGKVVTESTHENIAMPVSELLEYAASKNANTQFIMESFDLSLSDIQGVSKNSNHIILRDGANSIYTNVDPMLKKELNSYLSTL